MTPEACWSLLLVCVQAKMSGKWMMVKTSNTQLAAASSDT